ncbi:MAG: hypothetical protein Q7S28_02255 [bacterium]|nr:hypothetical protein [bacterium]
MALIIGESFFFARTSLPAGRSEFDGLGFALADAETRAKHIPTQESG